MTRKHAESMRRLYSRLESMGFDVHDIDALIRIERTLQRWAEQECGDANDYASWSIERDEQTGKPYRVAYPHRTGAMPIRTAIPDREKGALRRLHTILVQHPGVIAYRQTDPRGCALYLIPYAAIGDRSGSDRINFIHGNYSSIGVAVCY